jgi:hypothetical protein
MMCGRRGITASQQEVAGPHKCCGRCGDSSRVVLLVQYLGALQSEGRDGLVRQMQVASRGPFSGAQMAGFL